MKNLRILSTFMLWGYVGVVIFLLLYDFSDRVDDIPMAILGIPFDKIVHFLIFMTFSITLSLYRMCHKQVTWLQYDVVILLLGALFAIVSELLQLLTPYRGFSFNDIFADLCGVVFGLIIFKLFQLKCRCLKKIESR